MNGKANMKEGEIKARRRAFLLKNWTRTVLEIGKWALVLWLLWPLRNASAGPLMFSRVALGVLLFVIFAGKLFYDTVIMGIIRQRRTTLKQDVVGLIGIVVALGLVVGLVLMLVVFLFLEFTEMMNVERGA